MNTKRTPSIVRSGFLSDRRAYLLLPGVLCSIFLPGSAFSACSSNGDTVQIVASCDDLSIGGTKSGVTIGQAATVSPFFAPFEAVSISPAGTVTGIFLNQGTIASGFGDNGFVNHGYVSVLSNEGTITNSSTNTSHAALINNNEIGTLTNKGTISATTGSFGSGAQAILQNAHIGTLDNAGIISAQNRAIYFTPGFTARIDTLINSGTIEGGISGAPTSTFASAIELGAGNSIGTIINTGTIDHSVCDAGGTCYAAINNAGGSIGTITNQGTLTSGNTGNSAYGIINGVTGSIGTLNNAQGDLKYYGTLPANYNTIIASPGSYGKLYVTAPGSGTTTFGIAPGSVVAIGTYAAVLNGISAGNLVASSGVYGGGLMQMNWNLSNPSATQWDLTTSSTPVTPTVPGTSSGNKLSSAILFSFAGAGTTAVASGGTLVGAIQSLTPGQVKTLSNVHAEGYSSNMTINLEQMGHVTNTVMDRIHAPLSGQNAMSTAYEVDQGRYLWVDASAMKGTVSGYDNLAGFGYQLSNLVIGRDILRDPSGGFGVFGGVGYTKMTEPEQVSQDFSSTNYFLGLYGGQYLPNSIKLSGAAGYVYSDSSATRFNPNVGAFTGGAAKSEYQSNGVYAALKLSRPFLASERLTLTPFVGASYAQLWMGRANESGGNDFNYSISSSSGRSVLTFVGGEFLMPLRPGVKNSLSLAGFYRFGYDWSADKNAAHEITANSHLFGSFSQIGANKGPVNNLMGLGLQGYIAPGVSVRAGIVGRISTHGSEIGGGGEIRWEL
ncbi:MAG: autotransporter domain-containing protein [Ferribacterium limneticum]